MEIQELKSIITKKKNAFQGLNSKYQLAEISANLNIDG